VRSLVVAPVGAHSAKPPEVRDRLVALLGDVPRVELFAREAAPGWVAIGNGIDGRDIRQSIGVVGYVATNDVSS
jgi:N6-adenosine-specific RNA methylase IME4